MATLALCCYGLSSFSTSLHFNYITRPRSKFNFSKHIHLARTKIKAVSTVPDNSGSKTTPPDEPPSVKFAFIHSVLLPDGTPDVHFRTACGGQKLRNVMLDSNIELYGPYARPLLNCGGIGVCGTCIVEIVEGKELLSPRTDKEKEKLKKEFECAVWAYCYGPYVFETHVVLLHQKARIGPYHRLFRSVQQLPEWKAHEWSYERIPIEQYEEELQQFQAEIESESKSTQDNIVNL